MKKLVVFLVTAVMVLNLAGCGNRDNEGEGTGTGDDQQSTIEDSTPDTQPEVSSQPESDSQPQESTQTPEGGQDGISENMSAIRQAVVDALGDNYWPNSQIAPEYLESYGLTSDMYVDFWGEMPMISTNVDTIIVIKAAEGQIDAVETALNSYRDTLINDTMQYPMNVGKIQASRIEVVDDYACFVQLGADTIDLEEEDSIRHCQEQNEMALEAIEKVIRQ